MSVWMNLTGGGGGGSQLGWLTVPRWSDRREERCGVFWVASLPVWQHHHIPLPMRRELLQDEFVVPGETAAAAMRSSAMYLSLFSTPLLPCGPCPDRGHSRYT